MHIIYIYVYVCISGIKQNHYKFEKKNGKINIGIYLKFK